MDDRTTWTCSREFGALHTIECSYIGNFFRPEDVHSVTKCPLRYESPLRYDMKTCSIFVSLLPAMTISQNQI